MMINEKMDDMMMVFNDCYPVEAYKKHYLTARMIQCDAEKFKASNEDDVEKCMDELIFCPKCEGTQHEHNLYNPRVHHPMVRAAQYLIDISYKHIFFGLIVIPHHSPNETYIPESYYCQTCNHCFLSSNTYSEEIRFSKIFRKKSLWRGLLFLAFAAFEAAYLIAHYCIGFTRAIICAYILLSIFLTLSFIFLGSIFFSAKEAKKTLEEWKQFQDIQAKHTKTINGNSEEYIPAWKRVQMEQ